MLVVAEHGIRTVAGLYDGGLAAESLRGSRDIHRTIARQDWHRSELRPLKARKDLLMEVCL
jgi:hypothetical protein